MDPLVKRYLEERPVQTEKGIGDRYALIFLGYLVGSWSIMLCYARICKPILHVGNT